MSEGAVPRKPESRGPESKGNVLVVDDKPEVTRALARVLTQYGYTVEVANSGAAAIARLVQFEFDVVLSDIAMPGMSGVDLLRGVRERDLDLPVILMTGQPSIETALQALDLGALQYLQKPFANEIVRAAVERACRLHRIARIKREALALHGRLALEAGDRAGLSAGFDRFLETMWIAYQPIVEPGTRTVVAYEALLRSNEPSLPYPPDVLNAAERLDRLPELGRRIRHLATTAFAQMPEGPLLFVNLHTRDLDDPELTSPDSPLTKISHRVVLEVTEREALGDVRDVRTRIAALRRAGFRIAIDDLGAGYAGLTSFALLEPEFVKIDMSLVRGVHGSPIQKKLIGMLAAVCGEMGVRVIAEGVETVEESNALADLGCGLLQGYLFARPGRPFPSVEWH